MKRILAPILLFPALAYGATMKDLGVREGLPYKKFNDVPFTGKATGKTHMFLKNGQKSLKNGRYYGPWGGSLKDGTVNDEYTRTSKNGVGVK